MNSNDYVAVGLPVPLSYTGKPGCIGVSDANGNPVLGTGPGSRLLIKATIVLTETSTHNVTANINSARVN